MVARNGGGYGCNEQGGIAADHGTAMGQTVSAAARAALRNAHDRLTAQLTALSDAELYGGPMKGGGSLWTTGRWAEAAGPSHYRSTAKFIRGELCSAG